MAGEDQNPSVGWGAEVWLSTDETSANLKELVQVTQFAVPGITVDQEEVTTLKSPGKMKEFIDALGEGEEVGIVLNFRPGSDTDEMAEAWEGGRGRRAIRFNVPIGGVPVKTYDGVFSFAGYNRGEVTPGGKMEATLNVKLSGPLTSSAYSVPA
ncbi:phage tail tube protein [Aurantiacibacter luteus]|uniref:Phage tail protein n=1 Tax=Aurantiacibacter luteus TaxID=1581420 RepID=A0A0G9MP11_9SPHN|nr:phage tail tube protein [Aurantiacibacter luteus]KLE32456.1 hypothetical protein AAW00_13605 [Aurantiacibacter luteus]